jgi:MFS family permease
LPAADPSANAEHASVFTALSRARAIGGMLGICFVIALAAFDQALVGVALPSIVAELKGFDYYAWVGTTFLLCSTIAMSITGRLGDLFGRKPFMLAALIIFCGAALVSSMAESMPALVVARAVQGLGGGMLFGTSFAAVVDIFPNPMQRVRWQVMLTFAFGLSNAAGPSLGGYLTSEFGWRSTFLVTLPFGAVAFLLIALYLPRVAGSREPGARLDWLGALLLSLGVGALLALTNQGAAQGGQGFWTWRFLGLLLVTVGIIVLFVRSQLRARQPILPLHLFELRAVRLLSYTGIAVGVSSMVLIFYSPLLLQAGLGLSPSMSGLLITPLIAGSSLASLLNSYLFVRVAKPHLLMSYGLFFSCLCYLAALTVHPGMAPGWIAAVYALGGFGLGFQWYNLTILSQSAVERRDVGTASALSGVLITGGYAGGIAQAPLIQSQSTEVVRTLSDPQVLVNAASLAIAQHELVGQQGLAPAIVATLFDEARVALIGGVHRAFWFGLLICFAGFLFSRRIPPILASVKLRR